MLSQAITDVVPYHKSYQISEKYWCDKALMLKHGGAERAFPMDILSNTMITQVLKVALQVFGTNAINL